MRRMAVRVHSYQERALPTELCGILTLRKVEGVGFEPTQPVRAADLQSAPINHSGTPPDATIKD